MSKTSKIQPYTYTLKTAAIEGFENCGRRVWFYLLPPENAITIENIWTHFAILFDGSVSVDDMAVERIGIMDATNLSENEDSEYTRAYTINKVADGNGIIDFSVDLSALLKKDNVAYQDLLSDNEADKTLIFIDLPEVFGDGSTYISGEVNFLIWKTEALFTTSGIR